MSQLHIICNPVAGNGAAQNIFSLVSAALDERGIPFTAVRSAYPGHAVELARQAAAEGKERITVVGGDGTVREVAIGLLGTSIPMAIIPSGTGNDLSRPLGIPKDPLKALELALSGEPRCMDAATANEELFFNVAGFGFDVDVLDYTEIYKKKTKNGSLAYLQGLFRALTGLKNRKAVLTWPEGRLEGDVLIVAVGNGTHFGGGMMVTPQADPFDGLLDVCIATDIKKRNVLGVLPKFLKGQHLGNKHVTYFRTTELTATCEPVSRLDIDGEVLPGTPVTFKILPKRLWVVPGQGE